jgi:hypothetical protein
MEGPERRRAPRVPVDLHVRYRRPDGDEYGGTLVDISTGGVRLVGGEAFTVGTRVEIRFFDPQGRRHELSGDVVRSEPRGGFAVSLVAIDDATLAFVREALAKR